MLCNFCGKTLDTCEELNLGNLEILFYYGSKRDGDKMKFALCSNCYDRLADEFMSRCKHEPKIVPFGAEVPEWEHKTTEEIDY